VGLREHKKRKEERKKRKEIFIDLRIMRFFFALFSVWEE
jgi:hypothetical protein